MKIPVNHYSTKEHDRAINEDNCTINRSCDFTQNDMCHIHNSAEVLFVESGKAVYHIDDKEYVLEKNDILVISSMHAHAREVIDLPFSRYGITIKEAYYKSFIGYDDILLRIFETPTTENYVKYYKNIPDEQFSSLINILERLSQEKDEVFMANIMQKHMISELAITLSRTVGIDKQTSSLLPINLHMNQIKEYVDTNYVMELSLQSLSQKFYLHPTTISKEFHRCFRCNINEYIHMVRITVAVQFLETTNDTILCISELCGYNNLNTFLRQFKKIMKISPNQYRKNMKEYWKKCQAMDENQAMD